jgi:hypothetical protein
VDAADDVMTARERREVIYAIGRWDPIGFELEPAEAARIREQFAEAVAPVLGVELEEAYTWLDVARMTS